MGVFSGDEQKGADHLGEADYRISQDGPDYITPGPQTPEEEIINGLFLALSVFSLGICLGSSTFRDPS